MSTTMIPKYNNKTFKEVFENEQDFVDYISASFAKNCISIANTQSTYWLLYSKYANNPIANNDENQAKSKFATVIFKFGPSWQKKLEIQEKLRNLTDDEILKGTRIINNRALNPSTIPTVDDTNEICEVSEQNVNKTHRGKIEGYAAIMELIKSDVTSEYIDRFMECFQKFVVPNNEIIYIEEELE